jgi:hypothetical protein
LNPAIRLATRYGNAPRNGHKWRRIRLSATLKPGCR